MKLPYLYASSMLICLVSMGQTHAVALQKTAKTNQNITSSASDKTLSPIEKALSQQKREKSENKLSAKSEENKVISSLKNAPTQTFLATQNQQFSRFLQSIFPQQSS